MYAPGELSGRCADIKACMYSVHTYLFALTPYVALLIRWGIVPTVEALLLDDGEMVGLHHTT